jgi:exonuclease SbcC
VLEKLTIVNFQVHKKLVIEFDNITTITGSSDRGKSAIIRALKWVCQNKPSGDAFRKWHTDKTKVSLVVDGIKVTREKSNNSNSYRIDDQKYVAFGAEVPKQVAMLLNMGTINFQSQHDKVFWFSESAGQVSRELNQIVNLGVIDSSLKHINTKLRKATTEVEIHQKRVSELEGVLETLEWVDDASRALDKLVQRENRIREKTDRLTELQVLIGQVEDYTNTKRNLKELVVDGQLVSKIGDKAVELHNQITKLGKTIDQCDKLQQVIANGVPDTSELEQVVEKSKTLIKDMGILNRLLINIKDCEDDIKELQQEHQRIHSQLEDVKECPLCHQKLE